MRQAGLLGLTLTALAISFTGAQAQTALETVVFLNTGIDMQTWRNRAATSEDQKQIHIQADPIDLTFEDQGNCSYRVSGITMQQPTMADIAVDYVTDFSGMQPENRFGSYKIRDNAAYRVVEHFYVVWPGAKVCSTKRTVGEDGSNDFHQIPPAGQCSTNFVTPSYDMLTYGQAGAVSFEARLVKAGKYLREKFCGGTAF